MPAKPAGDRDQRVTVKRLKTTSSPDQGGHVDESDPANWEIATNIGDNGRLWASVAPRASREFVRGDQVAGDITHQVEVLYSAGRNITQAMRLTFQGPAGVRTLNIAEPPIDVENGHHSLRFACIEPVESK